MSCRSEKTIWRGCFDCTLANGAGKPVVRARTLSAYREDPLFFAVGRAVLGVPIALSPSRQRCLPITSQFGLRTVLR
jgi:hypothetical protein